MPPAKPQHDLELGQLLGGLRADMGHLRESNDRLIGSIEFLTEKVQTLQVSTVSKATCEAKHGPKASLFFKAKERIVALSLLLAAVVAIGALTIRGAHFIVQAEAALKQIPAQAPASKK